jgi:outer membrane protein assembly factor BamB
MTHQDGETQVLKQCAAALVFLVICCSRLAFGADFETDQVNNWHQWRGPEANGFAPRAKPPLEWDEKTNVKWKVAVPGDGSSTPIVWGNQIFIQTAVQTDRKEEKPPAEIAEAPGGNTFHIERPTNYFKFVVMSFDRSTGTVIWEREATEQVPHEGHHQHHGFASQSPVTDGEYLYVSFGSRGIYCYDLKGNLKWTRDLGKQRVYRFFGEASSPVLHGDALIVNWDNEAGSFLVALDTRNGDTKWKVDRDEHSSWATPLIAERNGKTQIVVNGGNKCRGYDFETGDVIWECGGQTQAIIPSPVAHDGLVYCMSGYPGSALIAIPLDSTGDISGTDKIAWKHNQDTPYCPSPLLYGDRLWFNKANKAVLTSLDARTGRTIIDKQRMDLKTIYASPVGADGKIYFADRDGATLVLAEGPKYKVLSTNRLDGTIDASPALVGKEIFLRSNKHLYCITEN